ncbi:MAG: hypothetical protein LH478_07310 [Chitinophagaceae bacterium]|nr:hypothetical protein [Chitinophagaceae bacterium]
MKRLAGYLLLLVIFVLAIPYAGISQKAYAATRYKATVKNLIVTFNLAEGYFSASELKIYNKISRQTSRFLPETGAFNENEPSKFIHYSPSTKKYSDYFLVEGLKENDEMMPAKINAVYYSKSKPVKFVLIKK